MRFVLLQVNQERLDPALSGNLLAAPLTKTTVGIWNVADITADPVSLIAHKRSVTALAFSWDEPKLLCSAGSDFVIVWNVRKCLHNAEKGGDVRGEVILHRPGDVAHTCFSIDAATVALCVETIVKIVSVATANVVAELVGHANRVTAAEFCPHFSATLVTASDDRSVIVWDVENFTMVYRSAVISGAPLISLCMNRLEPHVAVASAGGNIKVFDLGDGKNFRQLWQLHISRILNKRRQNQPASRDKGKNQNSSNTPVIVTRGGTTGKTEFLTQLGGGDWDSKIESSDAVHSMTFAYHGASRVQSEAFLRDSQKHDAVREVCMCVAVTLIIVVLIVIILS
jgi:WD40 repeat protein